MWTGLRSAANVRFLQPVRTNRRSVGRPAHELRYRKRLEIDRSEVRVKSHVGHLGCCGRTHHRPASVGRGIEARDVESLRQRLRLPRVPGEPIEPSEPRILVHLDDVCLAVGIAQVVVVDLTLRTIVASIPFNAGPANPNNGALDIEIDRQGRYAYVLGFDTVNVIDLSTDILIATIPVGIQVSDVAVDPTGAFVYVTTLHQEFQTVPFNEIVRIETSGFTIQDRFVIGGLLIGLAVGPAGEQVTMDIKPGSLRNSINPGSKGVVPVAILTTTTFDATTVDPSSAAFGPDGAVEIHGRGHVEDVNGDGALDLVLHFPTRSTGISCGDTSASLTGETFDGRGFTASDRIETVGCD